jgi:hypothetical protein
MGLIGDEAQLGARFGPFGDSATLDARLVHICVERSMDLQIVLEAPDGTPR